MRVALVFYQLGFFFSEDIDHLKISQQVKM